jgi:hypothetical protein
MLYLPRLLGQLIEGGRWPGTIEAAGRQNFHPLVDSDRIRGMAPEESTIYLNPPPFRTIRDRVKDKESPFWRHPMSAPSEIDFDLSVMIGDFGDGSDAPILLDYRVNLEEPQVIRLRWRLPQNDNHWVVMAPDFETFVHSLGL